MLTYRRRCRPCTVVVQRLFRHPTPLFELRFSHGPSPPPTSQNVTYHERLPTPPFSFPIFVLDQIMFLGVPVNTDTVVGADFAIYCRTGSAKTLEGNLQWGIQFFNAVLYIAFVWREVRFAEEVRLHRSGKIRLDNINMCMYYMNKNSPCMTGRYQVFLATANRRIGPFWHRND